MLTVNTTVFDRSSNLAGLLPQVLLSGRMKRDDFFRLDDGTSSKNTSLFSRPQFFFQGAKSDGKKNKFDTKFEVADFVRQLTE